MFAVKVTKNLCYFLQEKMLTLIFENCPIRSLCYRRRRRDLFALAFCVLKIGRDFVLAYQIRFELILPVQTDYLKSHCRTKSETKIVCLNPTVNRKPHVEIQFLGDHRKRSDLGCTDACKVDKNSELPFLRRPSSKNTLNRQCDQIGRNVATLAKYKTCLAGVEGLLVVDLILNLLWPK